VSKMRSIFNFISVNTSYKLYYLIQITPMYLNFPNGNDFLVYCAAIKIRTCFRWRLNNPFKGLSVVSNVKSKCKK